MNKANFKERIRLLVKQVYSNTKEAEAAAVEYDELTKFPELKAVIVDLLTHEFDNFLASIDWVAPRPTTFRINLLNGNNFILMYTIKSWIATVEGKKYYLLNLDEEERCALAINRLLRTGPESGADMEGEETETTDTETPSPEIEDEVDVNVDVEA